MGERRKIFYNILESTVAGIEIKKTFKKRIKESNFSKDENEFSHFCVYFPAYDPKNKLVFIGHHKKSGISAALPHFCQFRTFKSGQFQ